MKSITTVYTEAGHLRLCSGASNTKFPTTSLRSRAYHSLFLSQAMEVWFKAQDKRSHFWRKMPSLLGNVMPRGEMESTN
jgi:hypothetical protein